jgi:hypothetical protein
MPCEPLCRNTGLFALLYLRGLLRLRAAFEIIGLFAFVFRPAFRNETIAGFRETIFRFSRRIPETVNA